MIGIFDSGFGGLTVFKEIKKQLPNHNYIYLGDNARAPYGNRSAEMVYEFTRQAVDFLFQQGAELIIIACNTVSAEALRKLQQEWLPKHYPERRILGVIRPVVESIAKSSKGRVGVMATRGTINSKAYEIELQQVDPNLKIIQQAAPLLVPLIEEGWEKRQETRSILRKYLQPLKKQQIDTLILGCTHYPILLEQFRKTMGKNVQVPNPGRIVAKSLVDYLQRHPEIDNKIKKSGEVKFYTTDNTQRFNELGAKFLGDSVKSERVDLF